MERFRSASAALTRISLLVSQFDYLQSWYADSVEKVAQGNVGLVTKFGRFARAVDPGLVKINPLSENFIQVDVKIQIVGKWCQHSFAKRPKSNLFTLQRYRSKSV